MSHDPGVYRRCQDSADWFGDDDDADSSETDSCTNTGYESDASTEQCIASSTGAELLASKQLPGYYSNGLLLTTKVCFTKKYARLRQAAVLEAAYGGRATEDLEDFAAIAATYRAVTDCDCEDWSEYVNRFTSKQLRDCGLSEQRITYGKKCAFEGEACLGCPVCVQDLTCSSPQCSNQTQDDIDKCVKALAEEAERVGQQEHTSQLQQSLVDSGSFYELYTVLDCVHAHHERQMRALECQCRLLEQLPGGSDGLAAALEQHLADKGKRQMAAEFEAGWPGCKPWTVSVMRIVMRLAVDYTQVLDNLRVAGEKLYKAVQRGVWQVEMEGLIAVNLDHEALFSLYGEKVMFAVEVASARRQAKTEPAEGAVSPADVGIFFQLNFLASHAPHFEAEFDKLQMDTLAIAPMAAASADMAATVAANARSPSASTTAPILEAARPLIESLGRHLRASAAACDQPGSAFAERLDTIGLAGELHGMESTPEAAYFCTNEARNRVAPSSQALRCISQINAAMQACYQSRIQASQHPLAPGRSCCRCLPVLLLFVVGSCMVALVH